MDSSSVSKQTNILEPLVIDIPGVIQPFHFFWDEIPGFDPVSPNQGDILWSLMGQNHVVCRWVSCKHCIPLPQRNIPWDMEAFVDICSCQTSRWDSHGWPSTKTGDPLYATVLLTHLENGSLLPTLPLSFFFFFCHAIHKGYWNRSTAFL